MSVTVTYKCDRCGATPEVSDRTREPIQFWNVEFRANCFPATSDRWSSPDFHAHWCRECLEFFGVHAAKEADSATPEPTASERLEAIIREITRDEVRESAS